MVSQLDLLAGNNMMVPHERAQFGRKFCEEECDPVEASDEGQGSPPSSGCVVNSNGTNVWNDGYPAGTSTFAKNQWKFTSAAANTLLIVIFGKIYETIAVAMNDWENHRTKTDYEDNLILKNFVFQFVNNYFVLFYIAYMRQVDLSFIHEDLGEIDAECKGGSCMPELSVQVGVVFTTKMLIAQVLEIAKPWLAAKKSTVGQALQLSKLQKQLKHTMAEAAQMVLPENVEEMLEVDEPTLKRKEALDQKAENLAKRLRHAQEAGLEGSAAENESYMVDYENTFDDFNEMAIQYGYLALFSPAYPLAPVLALANNIVEIRVDATKLCSSMRRPRWETAEDIGTWMTVLSSIGFAAVMVNSTMVAFVSSKHSYLGDRGLPETSSDDAGAMLAEEMGGFKARTKNWNLWLYAVGIEHAMLLLRVLVLAIFPDTPEWLDDAHDVLEYRLGNMKNQESIEQEKQLHDAFLEKLGAHGSDDHDTVEHLTTQSIKAHMETRKTAVKATDRWKLFAVTSSTRTGTGLLVANPMQAAFENPMLGGADSYDDDDDERERTADLDSAMD